MRISYDPEYDVLYIEFSEKKVADTVETVEGVLIDYGEDKEIVGIEIINASKLIKTKLIDEITVKIFEKAKI